MIWFKYLLALFWAVVTIAKPISVHEMKPEILKAVKEKLPSGMRAQVMSVHTQGEVPEGASLSIIHAGLPVGLLSFRYDWQENNISKSASGIAKVQAYTKIAVAKTMIKSGEKFTEKNIKFEERELTMFFASGYFTEWEPVLDLEAKGLIRPGEALSTSNTVRPYMISRGQITNAVHHHGKLTVAAKVKALQDGFLGDWIQVQNLTSNKILRAKIEEGGEIVLP